MLYDAIVVGAGPAGSTAARLLAAGGASVLLLDRARFPRDKPCGGGVTLRAAAVLGLDLAPVVERTIYGARFSIRMGQHFDRWFSQPLAYMTQRRELDAFLAAAAAEAGADFRDAHQVRELEIEGAVATIRCNGDPYQAKVVIGADGANGAVARVVGQRAGDDGVALEGNVRYAKGIPEEWRELVALDLGALAGGYGWVFPKGDHLNVGVGSWKYAGFTLRSKLAALSRRYGFDPSKLEDLRGHHLPLRRRGDPLVKGPALLIGDAAGLVDPLSGDGIHMAFHSAALAANSALAYLSGKGELNDYREAIEERLQPELDISRQLQELFHFAPSPYVEVMRRSEHFWQLFCRLLRGEFTYQSFTRRIGPLRPALGYLAGIAQRRRLARVAANR